MSAKDNNEKEETESQETISEAVIKEPTVGNSHIAAMLGSTGNSNRTILTIAGAISKTFKGEIRTQNNKGDA